MKNKIFFLILIILFSGACKSKPAPVAEMPRVTPTAAAVPSPTVPPPVTVTTDTPDTTATTTENTYGTSSSSVEYKRNSSGIILDGAVSYTVKRGDTLNRIARQYYKDGSLYPLIMMASGNVSDPDKILPRMRLTIPALRVNMDDPTARQSINRYFLQIANIEQRRGRTRTAALIRGHTRQ